jgi:hypothetical protein
VARQKIHGASRYEPKSKVTDQSYKNQAKRQSEPDPYRSLTNSQEAKRQKRIRENHPSGESGNQKRVADWTKPHCDTCGQPNHITAKCFADYPPAHPDRNIENNIAFELSTNGLQWIANDNGPFCNKNFLLSGKARVPPVIATTEQPRQQSKLLTTMLTTVLDKVILNKTDQSDYLSIFITLPSSQIMRLEEEGEAEEVEEIRSPGVQMDEAEVAGEDRILAQALLDTGCLVGDCMSQEIVDRLNASHLIVNIKTTICSGFDNNCSSDFSSLLKSNFSARKHNF